MTVAFIVVNVVNRHIAALLGGRLAAYLTDIIIPMPDFSFQAAVENVGVWFPGLTALPSGGSLSLIPFSITPNPAKIILADVPKPLGKFLATLKTRYNLAPFARLVVASVATKSAAIAVLLALHPLKLFTAMLASNRDATLKEFTGTLVTAKVIRPSFDFVRRPFKLLPAMVAREGDKVPLSLLSYPPLVTIGRAIVLFIAPCLKRILGKLNTAIITLNDGWHFTPQTKNPTNLSALLFRQRGDWQGQESIITLFSRLTTLPEHLYFTTFTGV